MKVSEQPMVSDVPLDEALERWLSDLEFHRAKATLESQSTEVEQSLGRVTAEPVVARLSSPNYYAAATDGLALASHETLGASPESPVSLPIGRDLSFVDTGSPMPAGSDTVVPIFHLRLQGDQSVQVLKPSAPWRNVRPIGEDLAAGEVILPKGHRIRSLDLSALIAGGIRELKVQTEPRVHVLPVGESLVEPGRLPSLGQNVDHTSPFLTALARERELEARRFPAIPESLEALASALLEHSERCDLVVLCAGQERGTKLLATALAQVGECTLHGVAVRPGHSVVLGFVGGVPVLGLSSHPVPAYLGFCLFGLPVFRASGRGREEPWPSESAQLAVGFESSDGVEEFLRVKMGVVDGRAVAVAEAGGHGTLMSLVRADGLIRVPPGVRELEEGSRVEVLRLRENVNLGAHLLVMGTHDMTYDLVRDHLYERYPEVRFHTAAVGGKTGLQCLRNGHCHGAAVHLFDPETGKYNQPFLERWGWSEPVLVIRFLHRWLGLAVTPGNPLGIGGLEDLARPDVRFVNRQSGSGTRKLIDYEFQRLGVDTAAIAGYQLTAHTHMSVASAVKGGGADVGPTISTAARSLGLDFIPCVKECLDFVFPKRFLSLYPLRALLATIRSPEFRVNAEARFLDYDFQGTGELVWETPE